MCQATGGQGSERGISDRTKHIKREVVEAPAFVSMIVAAERMVLEELEYGKGFK